MASEAAEAETGEGRAVVVAVAIAVVGAVTVVDVGRETAAEDVGATAVEVVGGSAAVVTEAGHRTGPRRWAPARGRSRARLEAR